MNLADATHPMRATKASYIGDKVVEQQVEKYFDGKLFGGMVSAYGTAHGIYMASFGDVDR